MVDDGFWATKSDNVAARDAAKNVRDALREAGWTAKNVRVSQNDPDACYALDLEIGGIEFYVEVTKCWLNIEGR